jgi:AcrR family transcriptional regulator
MGMSIPYEEVGRTGQKRRTRAALVEAARSLIAQGITPTVEQAASEASISRTTAYRYFPNQRDLLVSAYPVIDRSSLLADQASDDPADRLDHVVDEFLRMTVENEPALRTALRLTLESTDSERKQMLLRRGRAIGWLKDALKPLEGRLSQRDLDRLVRAIRAAAGLEALVWLCDVGGLSRKQAVETMKWSARALLRSALAEAATEGPSRSRA